MISIPGLSCGSGVCGVKTICIKNNARIGQLTKKLQKNWFVKCIYSASWSEEMVSHWIFRTLWIHPWSLIGIGPSRYLCIHVTEVWDSVRLRQNRLQKRDSCLIFYAPVPGTYPLRNLWSNRELASCAWNNVVSDTHSRMFLVATRNFLQWQVITDTQPIQKILCEHKLLCNHYWINDISGAL